MINLYTSHKQYRLFSKPLSQSFTTIQQLWKGGYLDPTIGIEEKKKNSISGDAWPSIILKNKSFDDLHKLWYICLKEKNFLLSERWACYQRGIEIPQPGRIKKCKLSMKRILGELTRREINQQVIKGKEILENQYKRENLETKRFHLEEQILRLKYHIKRLSGKNYDMINTWKVNLYNCEIELKEIMTKIITLREETLQQVSPDWHYERKYSDLPGPISWKKQKITALLDQKRNKIKFY